MWFGWLSKDGNPDDEHSATGDNLSGAHSDEEVVWNDPDNHWRSRWWETTKGLLPLLGTILIAILGLWTAFWADRRWPWIVAMLMVAIFSYVRLIFVEQSKQVVLVRWHGGYVTLNPGPRLYLVFDRIRFITPTWKIGHEVRIEFVTQDGVAGYLISRIFIRVEDAAQAYLSHGQGALKDLIHYGEVALRDAISQTDTVINAEGGGSLQNWGPIDEAAQANAERRREQDAERGLDWGAQITNFTLVDFKLPQSYRDALEARAIADRYRQAHGVDEQARAERVAHSFSSIKDLAGRMSGSDAVRLAVDLERMQTATQLAGEGGTVVTFLGDASAQQQIAAGAHVGSHVIESTPTLSARPDETDESEGGKG